MYNAVGYADTAELAWLAARHEREMREMQPAAVCELCGREYDPDDLRGGICAGCAAELYTDGLGRRFAAEHTDDWLSYTDGIDLETLSEREERNLMKDFALDDIDEWRDWLNA